MSERAKVAVKASDVRQSKAAPQRRQPKSSLAYASPWERIIQLQRTIGNHSTQRLYRSLRIGQPNDIYEQEADRVAERVMRMPEAKIQMKPACPFAEGRSCEDGSIQTKSDGRGPASLTPSTERAIACLGGQERRSLNRNKRFSSPVSDATSAR